MVASLPVAGAPDRPDLRFQSAAKPMPALCFPVVQACAGGAGRRIEIPAEGQDPDSLEGLAPGVRLLPAAGGR